MHVYLSIDSHLIFRGDGSFYDVLQNKFWILQDLFINIINFLE